MPILADIPWVKFDDGTLNISMVPPIAVGGWTTQFQITHRFGGTSGLITKNLSSGFLGVSGIGIANSGQGVFQIALNSLDTSGLDPKNYAYTFSRLDSGYRTALTEGFFLLSY